MQTLLGDMVNQLAMFIVVSFFVRPSTDPCPDDTDLSSEIYDRQKFLWWLLVWLHGTAFVMQVGRELVKDLETWYHVWNIAYTVVSIAQMVVLSEQLRYMQDVAWNQQFADIRMQTDYYRYNEWMVVEICLVPAIMMVNMIFIFVRCFVEQKLNIKMTTLLMTEEADFVLANSVALRLLTSTLVPGITSIFVALREPSGSSEKDVLGWIMTFQLGQGISILLIFFVSLKQAPDFITNPITQQKYLNVIKKIVLVLAAGSVIVVPVVVILLSAFQLPNASKKLSSNYFVACIVLQILFLVRLIRSDYEWIKGEFLNNQKESEKQEQVELKKIDSEKKSTSINGEDPRDSLLGDDKDKKEGSWYSEEKTKSVQQ